MPLLICSFIADLIFGDPEWLPHPVKLMGRLINFLDKRLQGDTHKWMERIKGGVLAFIVIGISAYGAYLLLVSLKDIHPLLGNLAWVYLGYTTLSVKDLFLKAKAVLKEIKAGSITEARDKLSQIVGRDTQPLSEDKIIRAAVESIAESTNDGIIAPLFYLILAGPVLAIAYKAINTLDSMVGYRNERYINLGWASARLDDAANFLPARITGVLIPLSSFVLRKGFKPSLRIMLRDGKKHPSPNSGISEAAMAGALGIRLGGPSTYQGRHSEKAYLGEERRSIMPAVINEALAISFTASVFMVLLGMGLQCLM